MRSTSVLTLATFASPILADTHSLFAGFFSGSVIVGLEYDDVAQSLTLVDNITATATSGQKWISLDSRKENLYVATTGYFQSYAIGSDLGLTYESNVSTSSDCTNANFISVSTESPYTVFGGPYGNGCPAMAISVDDTGTLVEQFANVTYDSSAGVHGMGMSLDNDFIYSADDIGNGVWTHSYDSTDGTITELQHLDAPTGSDPRHLAVHPNGQFVYVVYEASSEIAVYARDNTTGLLTDTNTTYPLLPSSFTNSSSYWAGETLLSKPTAAASVLAPKYLIASTRSRTTTIPGYVSAFALDADTGAITSQLFLLETTGSGGSANAVSPSSFSEEVFAITDAGSNFIEMWEISGSSAAAVAHLDLAQGPANAVWYS